MRLPHRRMALAFVVAAGAVAVWPAGNAGATAPVKTGYWAQPQAATLPAPLPPPPDPVVPPGGLYVANTPDGPKAVAAVSYEVEGEVSATLVLHVHSLAKPPSEAPPPPEQPPSLDASIAHLSACVVEGDWAPPADGGAGTWEHRPTFDPANCVFGQFSTDGATVTFPLGPERQQQEGVFNVAIVPDPSYVNEQNTPFSLTFLAPGEESLTAGDPAPVDEEEEPEPIFDPAPADSDFEPGTFEDFTGGGTTDVFTTPTTLAARATPTTLPRVNLAPKRVTPAVAVAGDGRGERIMAVSLLMALAVGWWWFGGQQSRGPQLLGSLAGEGRRPRHSSEPTGGIGRFARPRDHRPRPLL